MHLLAKTVSGYGAPDRLLPCSGFSRSSVTASPGFPQVKIADLTHALKGASFVCKASSNGNRKNPKFSRDSHGASKSRKTQNKGKGSLRKNGKYQPLSNYQSSGPNELEDDELSQLIRTDLQKTSDSEEDNIEVPKKQGRESDAFDFLIQLLETHKTGKGSGSSNIMSKSAQNRIVTNGLAADSSDNTYMDALQGSHSSSNSPPSKFADISPSTGKKSRKKFGESSIKSVSLDQSLLNQAIKMLGSEDQDQSSNLVGDSIIADRVSKPKDEPNMDSDLELASEIRSIYSNVDDDIPEPVNGAYVTEPDLVSDTVPKSKIKTNFSNDDDVDILEPVNGVYVTETGEKHKLIAREDLKAMKVRELRELAKSRMLKGVSRLKKDELVHLLTKSEEEPNMDSDPKLVLKIGDVFSDEDDDIPEAINGAYVADAGEKIEMPKERGQETEISDFLIQLSQEHKTSKGGDIISKSPQNGTASNGLAADSVYSAWMDSLWPSQSSSNSPPSKVPHKSPKTRKKFRKSTSLDQRLLNQAIKMLESVAQVQGSNPVDDSIIADTTRKPEEEPNMYSDLELFPDEDDDDIPEAASGAYFSDTEADMVSDLEPNSKIETTFSNVADDVMEAVNGVYVTETGENHKLIEPQDLKAMKVQELRELAKSRSLKGISKLKKGELVELLSKEFTSGSVDYQK